MRGSNRGVIVMRRAHKGDIGRVLGDYLMEGLQHLSAPPSHNFIQLLGENRSLFSFPLTSHCSLRRKDMKGGIADRRLMDFNHSFNHFLILADSLTSDSIQSNIRPTHSVDKWSGEENERGGVAFYGANKQIRDRG